MGDNDIIRKGFPMFCTKCSKVFDRYKEDYGIYDSFNGKVYYCEKCNKALKRVFKQIAKADLSKLEDD